MNYAEAAYFEGNHCQHVAKWHAHIVQKDRRRAAVILYQGIERRALAAN